MQRAVVAAENFQLSDQTKEANVSEETQPERGAKRTSINYHLRQRKPGRNLHLKKQTFRLIAGRQSQKTMFPRIPHGPNFSPERQAHSLRLI